jgi:hypothetical protein
MMLFRATTPSTVRKPDDGTERDDSVPHPGGEDATHEGCRQRDESDDGQAPVLNAVSRIRKMPSIEIMMVTRIRRWAASRSVYSPSISGW